MPYFSLPPDHELVSGLEFPAEYEIATVEVHLGANPAACRNLKGTGVPCVLYPKLADGSTLGASAHPGFVVEFPIEALAEAGANVDTCYLAAGANWGVYADRQADGRPVCEECLSETSFATDFPPNAPKLSDSKQGPCWSCCQMIDEGWADAQEEAWGREHAG